MRRRRWTRALIAYGALTLCSQLFAADDATLLRVFLVGGGSLVSYGEPARVGDRIVFSMPVDGAPTPTLRLVNIPASRVDWERTDRYAASARAARYAESKAEADYALLSNSISLALNQITESRDPAARLDIAERARRQLAAWPESHFNYREDDIRRMLALLDEAIVDLRAASGADRFDLTFVASTAPPVVREPLLSPPTLKETIEQVLTAARTVDQAGERMLLFRTALTDLNRDAGQLPADWVTKTRKETTLALRIEERIEQSYKDLTNWMLGVAHWRASRADVSGLERLPGRIHRLDQRLGTRRPDAIESLLAAVDAELNAARGLAAARARYARRAPDFRRYRLAMASSMARISALEPALEGVKASTLPSTELGPLKRSVSRVLTTVTGVPPPEELAAAHATLVSALHLAVNAADAGIEGAGTQNLQRVRDASSAAAGALMLGVRARTDIQNVLRPPQLP